MDFAALIPTGDTLEVTFKHKGEVLTKADGDPCTWTLWAPHSKVFKEATYTHVVDKINSSRDKKDKEDTPLTVQEVKDLHNRRVEEILDVTKTFDLEMNGEAIKYSRKKAKELLEMSPKILNILEEALQKDEGFI